MFAQDIPFTRKMHGPHFDERTGAEPLPLTVAFLKFQIDLIDAQHTHQLTPGEVHDLELEVRVTRWPEGHSELQLIPVSVEPPQRTSFQAFFFPVRRVIRRTSYISEVAPF